MAAMDDLSQGDILSRITIATHNQPEPVPVEFVGDGLSAAVGHIGEEDLGQRGGVEMPLGIEVIVAKGLLCEAAVVSQTCDIRDPDLDQVHVVPLFPIAYYDAALHPQIVRDQVNYLLPLSPSGASVADLYQLSTVSKESLASAGKIGCLTQGDIERLNMKLSIVLGRAALPDEVSGQLRSFQNSIKRRCSPQHQACISGVFADHTDSAIDLLVVVEPGDTTEKVRQLLQKWCDEQPTAGFVRSGKVAPPHEVTLEDAYRRTRLSLDYISFPKRIESL